MLLVAFNTHNKVLPRHCGYALKRKLTVGFERHPSGGTHLRVKNVLIIFLDDLWFINDSVL